MKLKPTLRASLSEIMVALLRTLSGRGAAKPRGELDGRLHGAHAREIGGEWSGAKWRPSPKFINFSSLGSGINDIGCNHDSLKDSALCGTLYPT